MYYYLLLQKLIKSHSKLSEAAEENTERKKIIHNLTIWRESLLTSSCTTYFMYYIFHVCISLGSLENIKPTT